MQNVFKKANYTVTSEWTDVLAPFACNYFGIRNRGTGNVVLRSGGDGDDEDVLFPNAQDSVVAPWVGTGNRFKKGECVFALRTDAGEQLVTVTWVR